MLKPAIEHHHDAAVIFAPDQASESLLKSESCLRQGILIKRVGE
jgi:hypothetical protein